MPFHHHGHCKNIVVKVGDIIDVGQLIGYVGKTGTDYAHDHYEVSKNKPVNWTFYPSGKSNAWVAANYIDPKQYINEAQNLPCKWTNKESGLRWLQYYSGHNVYHPGEDLNSGTGNQDEGNEIRSTIYGKVVHIGWNVTGWGNHIWIEELTKPSMPNLHLTVVANKNTWTNLESQLSTLAEWIKEYSRGRLSLTTDIQRTSFENILFQDWMGAKSVDINWYRENVTPLGKGHATFLMVNPEQWKSPNSQGTMTWGDPGKPARLEGMAVQNGDAFVSNVFHEICHALFFFTEQKDAYEGGWVVHDYLLQSPPKRYELLDLIDYQKLQAKLLTIKPTLMNQTKVVLGKDGKTVYLATPIAMSFEEFKKQAGVEGIVIPNPIPKAADAL